MSKSLSLLVYLKRQKKDPDGKMPLYVRVTIDGDNADFTLSRRILPSEWSQPKQKCIGKTQEALQLNAKIAKTKGDLTALFDRIPVSEIVKAKQLIKLYHGNDSDKEQQSKKDLYYHQQVITIIDQYPALKNKEKKAHQKPNQVSHPDRIAEEFDALIQSIEGFLQQSQVWMDDRAIEKTLMDAQYTLLLKFLYKVLKGTASHETFRKWVSTKNTFASFLRYRYKTDDQPLKCIPLKLAVDLNEYLTMTNSIGNNAAMKYIKNLKQVIDDAVVQGWLAQNPLESFKCSYIDPERQALTLDEVARIIDHELGNSRLSEVRDAFIFCCFTGFAYQEVYNLRPKDLTVGFDKKNWINTNRNKTKNPEFLPLLPIADDLIVKYRSHPYCIKYKKLLPVNSNQRFNAYLKEIGALCKIDLELTTHTARHTFATTIAIEQDIPLKIVSVMLGHRTQRTTEIYARASKPALSRHMSALQEKLFGDGRQLQVNDRKYSIDPNLPEKNKTKKTREAIK